MKINKKQKVKIYCDDNYFNKSINSLFFEMAQLTVHKNRPAEQGWRTFRGNNAFYAHKNLQVDALVSKGCLICPG